MTNILSIKWNLSVISNSKINDFESAIAECNSLSTLNVILNANVGCYWMLLLNNFKCQRWTEKECHPVAHNCYHQKTYLQTYLVYTTSVLVHFPYVSLMLPSTTWSQVKSNWDSRKSLENLPKCFLNVTGSNRKFRQILHNVVPLNDTKPSVNTEGYCWMILIANVECYRVPMLKSFEFHFEMSTVNIECYYERIAKIMSSQKRTLNDIEVQFEIVSRTNFE
jgi:hypothetical protein